MFKYTTVETFLSQEECNEVLGYSLDNLNLQRALVADGRFLEKARQSSIAFVDLAKIFPSTVSKLQKQLSELVKVKGYELDFKDEKYQFTEYKVGEFYNWHADVGASETAQNRYCSVVLQLTDNYTGGDLELMDEEQVIKFKKGEGNLFVFLSKLVHRVAEIEDGTRYSLVTWFKLKPIQGYKKTLM